MVTTLELQRRGLRYAVSVDAAATNASLLDLQRAGLPYAVEVADGATAASRAALEARGLRYFVPVAVGVATATKASLERQGLRYAVQADADILPADRRILEQQGLAYYVKVDSSGNSVASASGGGLLLVDETNGFATDFTHAVDAERVAVKTAGTVVYSPLSFFTNAGVSSKWVYNVAGTLVNVAAGTLAVDYDPVTHAAKGLLCEPAATNLLADSNGFGGGSGWTVGAGLTMPKNATGPMGANTAFTLTMSAGTGGKWFYNGGGLSGNLVWSIYAKAGTLSWVAMGEGGGSPANAAFFNVATGIVGTVTGRFSAGAIQAVGNGWYRCSAIVTGAAGFFDVQAHSADNQSIGWTAVGGETLFISAAQAEIGTVATSLIVTPAGATATRAADQYAVPAASINHSPTAGSWWVETYGRDALASHIISYSAVVFPLAKSDGISLRLFDGSALFSNNGTAWIGNVTRAASAFQSGSRAISYAGAVAVADAGSTTGLLAPTNVCIGAVFTGTAMNGWMRKLRYLPRRPSNAELQTMTT